MQAFNKKHERRLPFDSILFCGISAVSRSVSFDNSLEICADGELPLRSAGTRAGDQPAPRGPYNIPGGESNKKGLARLSQFPIGPYLSLIELSANSLDSCRACAIYPPTRNSQASDRLSACRDWGAFGKAFHRCSHRCGIFPALASSSRCSRTLQKKRAAVLGSGPFQGVFHSNRFQSRGQTHTRDDPKSSSPGG